MTSVEVVNIVGVLDFHRELDLDAVSDLLRSAEVVSEVNYTPKENHWLQTRFILGKESRYVAFYRSGSCAIVGCESFEQLEQLVDSVKNAMEPVIRKNPTLEIKNIVCVGELNQTLNLSHVAIAAGLEKVEYEPEQFPGLIYRSSDSKAVFLVFASGKIVITGTTSLEAANHSFENLVETMGEWDVLT